MDDLFIYFLVGMFGKDIVDRLKDKDLNIHIVPFFLITTSFFQIVILLLFFARYLKVGNETGMADASIIDFSMAFYIAVAVSLTISLVILIGKWVDRWRE